MALRLRRGTDAERLLITPVEGELIYTTDTKLLYAGDGATAGGNVVTGAGGGGSTTLDALTDTDLTGASDNDVLTYNSGTNKWESVAVPGVGVLALNDLSDVTIGTPAEGQILYHNGTSFILSTISEIVTPGDQLTVTILSDDSNIMVDPDRFELAGNLTGNVTGDLTGASAGVHTGAVIGNVTGAVIGNVTGDVTGDVTGSVFGDDSTLIIDSVNNILVGNLIGDVTGDVTGNSTGIHTGPVDGDVTGSVFGDDSSLLVDGINNTLVGDVDSNIINATNLTGGDIRIGGDVPNQIVNRNAASTSLILTTANTAGTINSLRPLRVGGQSAGIVDTSVSIWNDAVNTSALISFHASDTTGTVLQTIAKARGNKTSPTVVQSADNLGVWLAQGFNGAAYRPAGGMAVVATGTPTANHVPAEVSLYTSASNGSLVTQFKVDATGTGTFTGAAQLAVYADNTARDAAITAPSAGMTVFNTTGAKFQGYDGSAWVNLN